MRKIIYSTEDSLVGLTEETIQIFKIIIDQKISFLKMMPSSLFRHQEGKEELETRGFPRLLQKKSKRECREEEITQLIISAFRKKNIRKMTKMKNPTSKSNYKSSSQNLSLMILKEVSMKVVLMLLVGLQDPSTLKY
jgi:hypothetical protein